MKAAQPLELFIAWMLFFGAILLPMLAAAYYTPGRKKEWMSISEYIRYCNDRDSGRIYKDRIMKIAGVGYLLIIIFVFVFCGCTVVVHSGHPASCEYDIYINVHEVEHLDDYSGGLPDYCPKNVNCYDWALEHGIAPDENGECWPYSRMDDDGRCYPI